MPASKARKAIRDRQLKAAEAEANRLQAQEVNETGEAEEEPADFNDFDASSAQQKTPAKKQSSSKTKPASKQDPAADGENPDKKVRFIVFVGKLPFTATTETIKRHFAKLEPASIRHLTKKGTDRSKGCAFLEFDRYDQMKECLKLYHHSLFDDGLGGEKRKINIELTVGGGGGKSRDRKEKLRAKNDKLAEERKRRATQRREAGHGVSSRAKQPNVEPEGQAEDQADIHPSRRGRIRV